MHAKKRNCHLLKQASVLLIAVVMLFAMAAVALATGDEPVGVACDGTNCTHAAALTTVTTEKTGNQEPQPAGTVTVHFDSLHDALTACNKSGSTSSAGTTTTVAQTVTLLRDVDLNNAAWAPVAGFKGNFDGKDKTISNLYITSSSDDAALLTKSDNATIQNVKIHNVTVSGAKQVGTIMGTNSSCTITNCHVSGLIQISGNYKVGGIAGGGYGSVSNCSVVGASGSYIKAVEGSGQDGASVGGIIGFSPEGIRTFSDCSVSGLTIEGCRRVGGIVGQAYVENIITGCTVSDCTIQTNATEYWATQKASSLGLGGIAGVLYQYSEDSGQVTNCSVSNVTFKKLNDVDAFFGVIVAGKENAASPGTAMTGSGNTASGVKGGVDNIAYLTDYKAKIVDSNSISVYYPSIANAIEAADPGDTVTVMADQTIDATVAIDKNITLDLNGKTVSAGAGVDPVFRILADVTVTDSSANAAGSVDGATDSADATCFTVGAGKLTVAGGNYNGAGTVVSAVGGSASIEGGVFKTEAANGAFMLDCSNGSSITVTGGTFHGFNPGDNGAQGEHTNFVHEDYLSELDTNIASNDVWKVRKANFVAAVGTNKYESLATAISENNTSTSLEVTLLGTAKLTDIKNLGSIKNLTIKGNDVTKAVMDICDQEVNLDGGITVTFDTVTVNGHTFWNYNGFKSGTVKENYLNCVINGTLTVHSDEVYIYNCDFKSDATNGDGDYSLFTYNVDNLTVEKCDFDVYERAVKLYSESVGLSTASFADCTFKSATKDKAAIEIAPPWSTTKFAVTINRCTAEGFAGAEHNGDADNALWNYEDTTAVSTGIPTGTVKVDGIEAYPIRVAEVNGDKYKSIAEAMEDADADDTIKIIANHKLYQTVVVDEAVTIDFNGHTVTTNSNVAPAFRILADVTVTDSGEGTAYSIDSATDSSNAYCFTVGDADIPGSLTVESGNYYGAASVVSVTNGSAAIEGGDFRAEPADSSFLLDCDDTGYAGGTAEITVTGGIFHGFNPGDNLAEGEDTNFVPDTHYIRKDDSDEDTWHVEEKIALTVTVDSHSVVKGAQLPTLTYSADGLLDEDDVTITASCEADDTSTLGTYSITATVTGEDAYKYTVTVTDGTLTVRKAEITVTVADKTKTYGDADPQFTGTVLFEGSEQLPDGITVTYSRTAGENAGSYPIGAALTGEGVDDYTVTVQPGTLKVEPKAVTVTVNNITVKVGDAMPTPTATTNGLITGDMLVVTLATTAKDTATAGTYDITATVTGDNGNYTVTVIPGTLTISDLNLDTNKDGVADENIDADNNGIPEYSIIKGKDATYTKGQSKALQFTANGTINRFAAVKVDGKAVDAKHYTAVSGSTVVTFKTAYLDTLAVGKHTLTVVYNDGEASCNFTVAAGSNVPNTGDNSPIGLWITLMAVSGAAIAAAATILVSKRSRGGKYCR